MAVRKLTLQLDLDSGGFTARVRDANGKLQRMSNVSEQTARSVQRMERRISGVTAQLRDYTIVLNGAAQAVNMMRVVMLDWFGAIVRSNAEIERMTFLIRGLSSATDEAGSIRETADNFEYLIGVAQNAPFSISSLTDTFVKFRSVGIDPTEGSMQSLVDAVAAFGGSEQTLHRASIAIQQMAGKGVISMEELRQQLGEAVPTALPMLARALNMSVDELVDNISQGRVRAEPALRALFGEFNRAFGGASVQMMNTFSGQMSRVQTQLRLFALEIGGFNREFASFSEDGLMGELTEQLREFTLILSDPRAVQFGREIGVAMLDALNAVKAFVYQMYEAREVIGNVARVVGALLVLRVVSGLAVSLGTAMIAVNRAVMNFGAQVANGVRVQNQAIAADRQRIAAFREKLVAQNQLAAATVQQRQADLAALQVSMQQIQTDRQLMANRVAEAQARRREAMEVRRITGQTGMLRQRTQELLQAKRTLRRYEQLEVGTRNQLTAATDALTAAQRRAALSGTRMEQGLQKTGRSARMAAGAMRALNGAMAFMGGWVGLALTVSMFALTFLDFEDAVKKAAEAVNDFNDTGFATEEGIEAQNTALQEQIEDMERLQALLDRGYRIEHNNSNYNAMPTLVYLTEDEIRETEESIRDLATAIERGQADLVAMETRFAEQRAEIYSNNLMRDLLSEERTLRREHNQELQQIYADGQAIANDATLNTEDREAAARAQEEARVEEIRQFTMSLISLYEEQARAQQAIADMDFVDPQDGKNAQRAADMLIERANQLRQQLPAILAGAVADLDDVLTDTQGSPITRLTRDLAELTIEAASTGDAVADATAAIQAGLVDGISPDTDAAEEYLNLVRQIAEKEEEIRVARQNDRALQRLADEAARAQSSASEMVEALLNGGSQTDAALSRQIARLQEMRAGFEGASEEADTLFAQAMQGRRLELAAAGLQRLTTETRRLEQATMTQAERAEAVYDERVRQVEIWRDAWIAAGRDIIEIQEIIDQYMAAAEVERERAQESRAERMIREWEDVSERMKDAQADWINDFIDGLAEGELKMGDFVKAILKDILKIQLQARLGGAINNLINGVIGGIGGSSGGTGSGSGFSLSGLFSGNHSGGIAGKDATFHKTLGFPQFHQGGIVGLQSNEVLSVLEKGEGVFTKEQMRALGGMVGSGGALPQIEFNIINQSGNDVKAEQKGSRFDGEKYIVDVVMKNLGRPSPMRTAVQTLK